MTTIVNHCERQLEAATIIFDTIHSDLDFIVNFADERFGTLADRYLTFAAALEQLFQRPVDLLTERSLRNPYFIAEVNRTWRQVYQRLNA